SRICGDHFLKEDIIDTWVSGQGTSKYSGLHVDRCSGKERGNLTFNFQKKRDVNDIPRLNSEETV
ncbi:bromodomain-containing protein DDB G0270170-like, partial [Aphis craccivora]